LELPIDHFCLLGVAPSADTETVLRTLERRLEHEPAGDFSEDILQMRAALLRASAERLADEAQRLAYESELTSLQTQHPDGMPGLEISSALDLGGLLLLHEAGQNGDVFEAASRALQPPRAPALGSTRESDLGLLAALACQEAAKDEGEARRFESAAHLLQRGSQLLQRMGQWPQERRQMEHQLEDLLPYRVLDLASRDLSCRREREEGIGLLRDLVDRRGGLEGSLDAAGMDQEGFQSFFKQIRLYLTVQEQLDLFLGWEQEGSSTAAFLGSYALIASGYAQRKPDRLSAAHSRLKSTAAEGLEAVLACLELLLGDVVSAEASFGLASVPAIQDWARQKADDPLAILCDFCCEWLNREVLAGYRDIKVVADLEAWFSDRDVQCYIESRDAQPSTEALTLDLDPHLNTGSVPARLNSDLVEWEETESPDVPEESDPSPTQAFTAPPKRAHRWERWARRIRSADLPSPARTLPALLAVFTTIGALTWWAGRQWPAVPDPSPVAAGASGGGDDADGSPEASSQQGSASASAPPLTPPSAVPPSIPSAGTLPLTGDAPTLEQLKRLLAGWLNAKAAVLSGETEVAALEPVARAALRQRVLQERQQDRVRGRRQSIEARIEEMKVKSRQPGRIEVVAKVSYRERLLSADDQLIEETDPLDLSVTYLVGRDGQEWRLHDYISRR